jgi:hypothetical protein
VAVPGQVTFTPLPQPLMHLPISDGTGAPGSEQTPNIISGGRTYRPNLYPFGELANLFKLEGAQVFHATGATSAGS